MSAGGTDHVGWPSVQYDLPVNTVPTIFPCSCKHLICQRVSSTTVTGAQEPHSGRQVPRKDYTVPYPRSLDVWGSLHFGDFDSVFHGRGFPLKDTEAGIRVLVGNIVQIAVHMGYHRDAKHFPNISPFAGEMRRRIWALIVQLDFSISTQMGLPRLIHESQTDVAEPRNLLDSDFNEHITKVHSVGVKVAEVATEPRPYSYAYVLELDKQIDDAWDVLPSSMKWDGLATSLNIPSQVIIQRIFLEVCVQRLRIILHKKFLVASRLQPQYAYSRSVCRIAAMEILKLQHLVDEETQLEGRLYQSRWRVTSTFVHDFLLATSILCFYLQIYTEDQGGPHDSSGDAGAVSDDIAKIRQLLGASQVI
ncbi:hypothetical protein MMC15_007408 [Xylographa vitiligo]|nr:hypothetical protein [Xylographa vitiligo]